VEQLAVCAGHSDSAGLHAVHMPALLAQIIGEDAYQRWQIDSSDWHLTQTLLRQCDGAAAAAALLQVMPVLAKMLDPKQEPTLRLTALSVIDHLLSSDGFTTAADIADWAEDILSALLLPNLVWRAGKAAEHVRLASSLCLSKLVPLAALTRSALREHWVAALPQIVSCLDDDNATTRTYTCTALAASLPRLGAEGLSAENTRQIYPELLKRLDDASDDIRLQVCGPLVEFFRCCNYSATYDPAANFDKTNYGYLLQGLLVHLDDPSPQIQQAVATVVAEGLKLDPLACADELRKVRDRQRSPKLVDALLERIASQGHGQLV